MIGQSHFYINTFFSSFLTAKDSKQNLGKDHTLTVGLTLGIAPHLEIMARLTPYQDDQSHIWGPPGDSEIGFKLQLPFSGTAIKTAVQVFATFPTAANHNVPYEPYSSGNFGAGLVGIATVDMTNSFPLFPLKLHVNFGYFDQTLKDQLFADEEDQFIVRAGLKFPIRSSILYTEYSAEVFANNRIVDNYRLNSQRITQGLKFLGPWNLIFDFALDVSLSKNPEPALLRSPFLKEYADWKVIFGINYPMMFQKTRRGARGERTRQLSEREKAKLREVQEKRQKVGEELKRMEKSLDSEKKKKKNDESGKQQR